MGPAAARCFVGSLLVAAALLSGCSTPCGASDDTVRFTDGHTNATQTYYESSSPGEPFVAFPAGRTIDFVHGLERTPDVVIPYVAFDSKPKSGTLAAGNEAVIKTDFDVISVRNDTCTDFYVRVVAWLADGIDAGIPSDAASPEGG